MNRKVEQLMLYNIIETTKKYGNVKATLKQTSKNGPCINFFKNEFNAKDAIDNQEICFDLHYQEPPCILIKK